MDKIPFVVAARISSENDDVLNDLEKTDLSYEMLVESKTESKVIVPHNNRGNLRAVMEVCASRRHYKLPDDSVMCLPTGKIAEVYSLSTVGFVCAHCRGKT